ncbi:MAG: LysM peptidoglycan-binding protein [Clostridia bacterium]|jgi:LysM repeat protein|nr:LysM peptidoglycan-binding protein [Clostridia bacterium]
MTARRNSNKKVIALQQRRKRHRGLKIDHKVMVIAVCIAIGIGVFLGLRPNAYEVIINDKSVGAIKDEMILESAKQTVMAQLKDIYHAEIKFEEEAKLKKYRAKKRDYIDPSYLVTYMRKNMNVLISFREIYVEGKPIGIVESDAAVEELKIILKKEYYGDKDVEVDFGKKVEVKEVFAKESDLINKETLIEKCTATTPKIVQYEVKSGDTLSGIADKFNISIENIRKENAGFTENVVLKIGEVINARINEPLLPLVVTKDNTVTDKALESPASKEALEGKKEE